MANSLTEYESLLASPDTDFLFIVFYRGHWCPFCISYLRDFTSLTPAITAARGTPIIVSAEAEPAHLADVRAKTGYEGKALADPDLQLAAALRARDAVDLAITPKAGYPKGMIQPGVVVVDKGGEVLLRWAIVPAAMNLGGAKDRPALNEIWEDVQALRNGTAKQARARYTKQSLLSGFRTMLFK